MDDNHLKQGVTSGQPLANVGLHKGLAVLFTVLNVQFGVQLGQQERLGLVLLAVHDGIQDLRDNFSLDDGQTYRK